MFKQIIEAIKSLFKSLFGGNKKEPQKPRPIPEIPDDEGFPKDAVEVAKDTIVTVNEMDILLNPPTKTDEDFDKDMFDEQPATPTTPTEPTPQADIPTKPETPITETPKHKPRYLWCFDNGHGEATPGKRSPLFDDGETRFFEYEFNRDIVKRIMTQLDKEGVKYYNVVPEVEGDISLNCDASTSIPPSISSKQLMRPSVS